MKRVHDYLGDGVYAEWDGHMTTLRVLNGSLTDPLAEIFLEPEVLAALHRFEQRCKEAAANIVRRKEP